MPIDLETLNEPQREAVLCTEGPLLVLAGAGSGKTRVLTHRIAHLVVDLGVAPWQVMAITFTNKAAAEMRERLGQLMGGYVRGMWVSTFHSMCVRILRSDCERLGFAPGFTIYDDSDSKSLVKRIMAELNIDPKRYPESMVRNRISKAKNELVTPEMFEDRYKDPTAQVVGRIYKVLQERLRALNAFDFDDLLLYTYLLLKNHKEVLEVYQDRFRYLLVDEYQDTNHAQYALTQLLAAKHRNIMVVGDDDQSIYSWRGADLSNILDFEKDYPEAHVVKLEENYRSTGNILAAANAVIENNLMRKRLYLTAALTRRIFGQTNANPVSRFIGEIPNELRKSIGVGSSGFSGSGWEKRGSRRGIAGSGTEAGGGRVFGQSSASNAKRDARSASAGKKPAAAMSFAVNDTVDHKVFGRGKVVKVDGDTLHVKFARNNQTKKLLKDYAPIVKIS